MTWVCKICGEKADFILEAGTSRLNKKGAFRGHICGYCKKHKPILMKIEDYDKAINFSKTEHKEGENVCHGFCGYFEHRDIVGATNILNNGMHSQQSVHQDEIILSRGVSNATA